MTNIGTLIHIVEMSVPFDTRINSTTIAPLVAVFSRKIGKILVSAGFLQKSLTEFDETWYTCCCSRDIASFWYPCQLRDVAFFQYSQSIFTCCCCWRRHLVSAGFLKTRLTAFDQNWFTCLWSKDVTSFRYSYQSDYSAPPNGSFFSEKCQNIGFRRFSPNPLDIIWPNLEHLFMV